MELLEETLFWFWRVPISKHLNSNSNIVTLNYTLNFKFMFITIMTHRMFRTMKKSVYERRKIFVNLCTHKKYVSMVQKKFCVCVGEEFSQSILLSIFILKPVINLLPRDCAWQSVSYGLLFVFAWRKRSASQMIIITRFQPRGDD